MRSFLSLCVIAMAGKAVVAQNTLDLFTQIENVGLSLVRPLWVQAFQLVNGFSVGLLNFDMADPLYCFNDGVTAFDATTDLWWDIIGAGAYTIDID